MPTYGIARNQGVNPLAQDFINKLRDIRTERETGDLEDIASDAVSDFDVGAETGGITGGIAGYGAGEIVKFLIKKALITGGTGGLGGFSFLMDMPHLIKAAQMASSVIPALMTKKGAEIGADYAMGDMPEINTEDFRYLDDEALDTQEYLGEYRDAKVQEKGLKAAQYAAMLGMGKDFGGKIGDVTKNLFGSDPATAVASTTGVVDPTALNEQFLTTLETLPMEQQDLFSMVDPNAPPVSVPVGGALPRMLNPLGEQMAGMAPDVQAGYLKNLEQMGTPTFDTQGVVSNVDYSGVSDRLGHSMRAFNDKGLLQNIWESGGLPGGVRMPKPWDWRVRNKLWRDVREAQYKNT